MSSEDALSTLWRRHPGARDVDDGLCGADGNLRAGAAKVDISPTKDMFPMKGMQV